MKKLKQIIVTEYKDYQKLLKSVPAVTMIFFVLSVVFMNIFANKQLFEFKYLALDCGFLLSWISFLCMDILTKRFGAKAAIKLSVFATGCNLVCAFIFWIIANLGDNWSVYYTYNDIVVNKALNDTFAGTWYVLLGSTIAFLVSSAVNALVNEYIGSLTKHLNDRTSFALRSYVSTALGQFVDNLVFATIVSRVFFGWSWIQVLLCSVTGGLFELVSEIAFSPIGFRVCSKWEANGVGEDYVSIKENMEEGYFRK